MWRLEDGTVIIEVRAPEWRPGQVAYLWRELHPEPAPHWVIGHARLEGKELVLEGPRYADVASPGEIERVKDLPLWQKTIVIRKDA